MTEGESVEELEVRLDEEIDRVQELTDKFRDWADAHRVELDAQLDRQLFDGDVPVSDYKFIVHALEDIDNQTSETLDFLISTFKKLAQKG